MKDKKMTKSTSKKQTNTKGSAGLTTAQKKLPPFIQKAIISKKKGK